MTGGTEMFRTSPRPDLAPAHAELVAILRPLVERAGVPLDELGAAVRRRLAQKTPDHLLAKEVARPGQRISALAEGSRFPDPAELDAIVALCTGGAPAQRERFRQLWMAAKQERALKRTTTSRAAASAESSAGGSRVGEARDWTRLGVHQPIRFLSDGADLTARVREGHLPDYVLREVDRLQLRPALRAARAGDHPPVRMVVIVGESSAGKTRMAVEAIRAELADWWLIVPRTPADLAVVHTNPISPPGMVVWLDEAQELLAQPGAAETVLKLLDRPSGPMVLLATLRTDAERGLTGSTGWRLLDRAEHRMELHRRPYRAEELRCELDRAAQSDDPWIREALTKMEDRYGIAEWLAAGPQLLRELGRARTSSNPVERTAGAVVDAAIDCYRAGYTQPIPAPLLRAAHSLYLSGIDELDSSVFDAALAWARRRVAGAVGLLIHDRGRGDQAFDYLLGNGGRHDAPPVDQRLWPLLLQHVTPDLVASIGLAAHRHGHDTVTRELIHRTADIELLVVLEDLQGLAQAADTGNERAASLLALLLAERGELTPLTQRADAGNTWAARRLADLLIHRGEVTTLAERADAGDEQAAHRLAEFLIEQGDVTILTERADAGDEQAAHRLAEFLIEQGDVTILTERADAGDQYAAYRLADLLIHWGEVTTVIERAGGGDQEAAEMLVELLAEGGEVATLIERAYAGDQEAGADLTDLLAEAGEVTTLTQRADAGDQEAAEMLADLRAEGGEVTTLTQRANAGDQEAAEMLADLLAELGDTTTLTQRADAGEDKAAYQLAALLAERGDTTTLAQRADAGDSWAGSLLAELLAERGDTTTLTQRADAGDWEATFELAELLAARGDTTTLTQRADAGDRRAAHRLAALLAKRGDTTTLTQRADAGDRRAAAWLAELLAVRGDTAALTQRADAGDEQAAHRLAKLLADKARSPS